MDWHRTFVGTLFVAAVTSLPEVVVTIAALRIGAGVALAWLNLMFVRSAAGLIIGGSLVFAATLFLGWWGTFAYLSAVAPVICWHIDDWLGLGGRIVWPGDPVRRVTTWADMSIPVRGKSMGAAPTPR